ncbi:MAG: NTP transferase domain-containing protein, partial [Acidobacteria bacterium]|nr:NTP transferase domain-containing protein [Acidobacteriota bacterium]
MQIIIPMSGTGSRFVRAGYRDLKPLIPVDGMPIIEHVTRMFTGEDDFLFICGRDALEKTSLREVLTRIAPHGTIVGIEPHKLGPVHAVLQASNHVRHDEPVVVNYCDFAVEWEYSDFKQKMSALQCAGCITAYRGFHPHSLGPNLYAYLRERDNYLLEIREKHCFTENRLNEYASAGTYYFRSGAMMLRYFQLAVERGLSTNGEFYASMPYNLLVEDGLDVFIYELKKMLQWGTPEDVEEYQSWSRYFAEYASWHPTLESRGGTNLIPMAGSGARFAREGYRDPKPLVPVAGTPMVKRSLDTLPNASRWVTVCQSAHLRDPRMTAVLCNNGHRCHIVQLAEVTAGQACSCLKAATELDPEQSLLIAPCDASLVFDEDLYTQLASDPRVDCLVWAFRDHPHANRNPKQYGWVQTDNDGNAQGILCKVSPDGDVRQAAGITGAFWFRKASFFLEAADRLIAEDRRINGEFYVDSVIQV